ncbi:GNAT family N-acetyltransferase [Mesobaculum littorinae]|uniref:GNAT family N-acetyltransferase n=1 Tax=Mesobaculum littorinae TaxID=2486419 RepID=A0A438AIG8_9RHOB|nr:GNAT family N-acetyltransferase [Mesobaculum littorinae]RVV98472.1 GNAT family N-acetyltransferase [Mesobaculum littorinae]
MSGATATGGGPRVAIHALPDAATRAAALNFVQASPAYSYLQDPDWPEVAPRNNRRHAYRLVTMSDAATPDGCPGPLRLVGVLRLTRLAGGYATAAFRRGPVTATPGDLFPLLADLLPALRGAGVVSLTLNPRWSGEAARIAEKALAAHGARPLPEARQTLHTRTGLVDLSGTLDDIYARFGAKMRRQLRAIPKAGLTTRPVRDAADLAWFDACVAAFRDTRGFEGAGHPDAAGHLDWVRRRGGSFNIVEHEGRVFGGFVTYRDGDRALPVSVAWAEADSKLPRTFIAFDTAIRDAVTDPHPPRWLDMSGLSRPEAQARDPAAARRDSFKMRFRPEIVDLVPAHEITLRPLLAGATRALRRMQRGSGA